jgi:hypothetical protein
VSGNRDGYRETCGSRWCEVCRVGAQPVTPEREERLRGYVAGTVLGGAWDIHDIAALLAALDEARERAR